MDNFNYMTKCARHIFTTSLLLVITSCGGGWDSVEKNYTPVEQLVFDDPGLRACANGVISAGKYRFAYEIEALSCNNAGIVSLGGIEALTSLRTLNLNSNNISDITPLAGLTELMQLGLVQNSISDVSALAGLINMEKLYLIYNNISDVSSLRNLTSLTELYVSANVISDVAPLSGLFNLSILDLRANDFSSTQGGNVDRLVDLSRISQLYLGDNLAMSCSQLQILLDSQGSPPVDMDGDISTQDAAVAGANCTVYVSIIF